MKTSVVVVASCLTLLSLTANAQFLKTKEAQDYRHHGMEFIGDNFKRMGHMVKGEQPYDKEAFIKYANLLKTLAPLPFEAFYKGTEGGDAKDEVFSDPEGFNKAKDKMLVAVDRLAAEAPSGDMKKIKVAFGGVGQSCKACHDNYRKDD